MFSGLRDALSCFGYLPSERGREEMEASEPVFILPHRPTCLSTPHGRIRKSVLKGPTPWDVLNNFGFKNGKCYFWRFLFLGPIFPISSLELGWVLLGLQSWCLCRQICQDCGPCAHTLETPSLGSQAGHLQGLCPGSHLGIRALHCGVVSQLLLCYFKELKLTEDTRNSMQPPFLLLLLQFVKGRLGELSSPRTTSKGSIRGLLPLG